MATTALSTSASAPLTFKNRLSSCPRYRIGSSSSRFLCEFGALRIAHGSAARRHLKLVVSAHLGPEELDSALDLLGQSPDGVQNALARVEGWLYTIADAAVATSDAVVDDAATTTTAAAAARDWLSGITDVMEIVLKVLKDGIAALNVPYAYGFAIILLTFLVKVATFPLTKSQVESTISMQNLQPKLKAIQERYKGNQERIQMETSRLYKQAGVNPLAGCLPTLATIPVWIGLYRALSNVANEGLLTEGFFWIPSLAGPTTIMARGSGSGTSWLFPFVDGQPPLGWGETLSYLVLPVLLIASQYASMALMQPPQTDPSQKNTQLIFKFLPLMIGYFALSVPSGLSLYWLTNNILSTGQQVWLRKLGGAKPIVDTSGGDIISAGRAKRSSPSASTSTIDIVPVPEKQSTKKEEKDSRRGERFKQLKAAEVKRKSEKAKLETEAKIVQEQQQQQQAPQQEDSGNEDTEEDDGEDSSSSSGTPEEMFATSANGSPNKKRSKRKRSA